MECTVYTVSETAPTMLSLPEKSCAEDAVLATCRTLCVAPITRHLFALRERQSCLFLADAAPIQAGVDYELRIRFKVLNLHHLRSLDGAAYDYYFRQARGDVYDNSVPEIQYALHKKELLGLGIADMYRAIQEDKKTLREVERNYKKYIPKEIIKKHQFFTKKPIHNTLEQWCQKVVQNPSIIKAQYLEQLTRLAPNYLSEEYSVDYMSFGDERQYTPAQLQLMPYSREQPGLRLLDKKELTHICTMEQLIFLGRKGSDTELEVCRKNGVPVYLRFHTARETSSFISGCGGYYRLMVKWTFSLSKYDPTPSLERLYNMKCHGPVGGEFSYHKLAEKGGKRHGCYILRQCQHDYDVYYIDVCTKSNTTVTHKVEFKGHCYIFNCDEETPYNSIESLIQSFKDPDGDIFLKDCLPPSEYDKSQLLLCGEQHKAGVRIDQAQLQELLKHHKSPRCINTRDMLIYKGPWCFNELTDDDNTYVKRYCDVPLCDDRDCELLTRPASHYTHYITVDSSWSNLEFSVRLWDADEEKEGKVTILLSVLNVAASREDIEQWGCGVELVISNNGTGLTIGSKEVIFEETPHILKATEYTNFTLSWRENMLVLGYPCVPWIDDKALSAELHTSRHDLENNENYCRNIKKKPSGPWCYALTRSGVVEQACHVRRCNAMDCKVAGTANDYLGTEVRGAEGITATYKAIWKLDETKKMEVALKTLVWEKTDTYLKDFFELANKWAGVQSSSVVRLYGVTLMSPSALVMEYLQYGPLDVYLSEHGEDVLPTHLMMGAAGLARALLDLSEAGCVHGRLRCSKVLLAYHDKDKFTVKLSDPGLHSYTEDDIHWIPVEFYSDLSLARRSSMADVWAFGTTLWEMFSYGLSPTQTNPVLRQKGYEQGHRLSRPAQCPLDVWNVILECWSADPHRRAIPQAIMRDLSHLLDRVSIYLTNPYAIIIDPDIDTGSGDGTVTSEWMFPNRRTSDSASEKSRVTTGSSISFPSTSVITFPEYPEGEEALIPVDFDRYTPLDAPHSMQWILGMGPNCKFTLQKSIGAGNYGVVHMAYLEREDLSQLQVVAVKILKCTDDQDTLTDFRKEVEVMKSLQHPNIVEILGVCEEGAMMMVMQYLEHGALNTYLKIYRDKLQHRDLLKYALDIASGMDYLSAKHLVHRDLAARNILVKDKDNVKISDFGLARFTSEDKYSMKTVRDLPVNWYSPEAATLFEFSSASDVWSYGVTLWEIFTYCLREVPKFHIGDAKAAKKRAECFVMPEDCPAEVYRRLMSPCWNYLTTDRPKFIHLVHTCKQLLLQY